MPRGSPIWALTICALIACANALGSAQQPSPDLSVIMPRSFQGSGNAVQLTSSPIDSLSQGVDMGDQMPASQQSDLAARPLTIEATPLDDSGEDDGEEADSSSSLSSASFGSGSGSLSQATPLRSASGSSAGGCGCPPEKPRRKCPAGIAPGPCGGGGRQVMAKIVDKLTGGAKKFHTGATAKDIWTFSEGLNNGANNDAEIQQAAKRDPVLQQLVAKLENLKEQMENEKLWVEDVQTVVAHYKTKAGAVAGALKNQANEVKALKAMIVARQKLAARKVLEQKLLRVNAQLQQLQATTSSVSGEAKSLVAVQQALNKSIHSIQSEIERLRTSSK